MSARPTDTHVEAPAGRDLAWEERFYRSLNEAVGSRSGMSAAPLIELAQNRMRSVGAAQYGDSSFLHDGRDLIVELRDEVADTIAYAVMELQKILAGASDEPMATQHLFESAVYACIADAHARAAHAARRR